MEDTLRIKPEKSLEWEQVVISQDFGSPGHMKSLAIDFADRIEWYCEERKTNPAQAFKLYGKTAEKDHDVIARGHSGHSWAWLTGLLYTYWDDDFATAFKVYLDKGDLDSLPPPSYLNYIKVTKPINRLELLTED